MNQNRNVVCDSCGRKNEKLMHNYVREKMHFVFMCNYCSKTQFHIELDEKAHERYEDIISRLVHVEHPRNVGRSLREVHGDIKLEEGGEVLAYDGPKNRWIILKPGTKDRRPERAKRLLG